MATRTEGGINLANNVLDFLSSAMVDEFAAGDVEKGDQYAIDGIIVLGLKKALQFYIDNGADSGFDATSADALIYKIREFQYALYLDIEDFTAQVGSDEDALGSGSPVVVAGVLPEPYTYIFVVDSDGQTEFTMPFDLSQLYDVDSIVLTLNDADPIRTDDFDIAGSTLTWTGEYPLSAGWKFELKYWM